MSTLDQISYSARLKMGMPSEDKCTPEQLADAIFAAVDYYEGELNLTDQNWSLKSNTINVDPNNDEYPLGNFSNFSKAVRVELFNDSNPALRGPEIKMVNFQDLNLGGNAGARDYLVAQGFDPSGSAEIASMVCFIDTPPIAIFSPKPATVRTYRIYYIPSMLQKPGRSEELSTIEARYHQMVACKAGKSRLPDCDYPTSKFEQYWKSITDDLAMFERQFDKYRRTRKRSDTRKKRPYRPSRRGGVGSGYYS